MKNKILIAATVAALCITACKTRPAKVAEPEPLPPIGFRESEYVMRLSEVKPNEIFPSLLQRMGLTPEESYTMTNRCDTVFFPRKMRAGVKIRAYYADSLATHPDYIVYVQSKIKETVFQCHDSLQMWNWYKPTTIERNCVDVTIHTSLWQDMIDNGAEPELIGDLSDIFAWTVNFFGLHDGDRFQVIYDRVLCYDEVVSISKVLFARYTGNFGPVNAIRVEVEGSKDAYYNEKGENLRKAFLKAPLKFNRVSSRFTYHRKHPVTGKVRPHTGVDYAAPAGTPVHALGDGTVISAGWTNTGGGNVVKIQHNSTYTTAYMHLKGFAKGIRRGAHVYQGQVIGYVGSTGMSTGPHLDFRVWKNGSPIDPLNMHSPAATPLPAEKKPELDSLYNSYLQILGE